MAPTTEAPRKKSRVFSEILQGFVRESRVLLLYTIPAASLLCVLKYFSIDISLLNSFITGVFLVVVAILEDGEALDTQFNTFVTRVVTALAWYHGASLGFYYVFEEFQLDRTYGSNEASRWLFRILSEYYDFIISIGMIRVYFNSFVSGLYLIAKIIAGVVPI